ncbi:MAG TPA: protein translocase subunit SecF [Ktedonobacteraceae bacterium]|nr:protein translocase subunit SecF [Ktedonobacteraceae bacterium]
MFHLVKHRYAFLILSLIVIVPGVISLILFGLNVGIDFAGGSSVELIPQKPFTGTEQVRKLLAPLNLSDLQVVLGNDQKLPANKTVWVRLNTQINQNVQTSIQNALKQKYADAKLNIVFTNITPAAGKPYTLVTISGFASVPNVNDIKTALNKLPANGSASSGSSSAPAAATATPAPSTTSTPGAKATPAPSAKSTPVIATTPTPATSSAASTPVSVVDVRQGTTTQTVTILTKSPIKLEDAPRIMSTVLNGNGPYVQWFSNSEVSGSVAAESARNAALAVLAASFFILLYIWFSFRKVPKAWRYGTCAIIAMLHDVLVVLGVFSILGKIFPTIQIDSLFITALLTVVGFSVHDTIVVFDRIRENMQRRTVETFEQIVDASLVQTMSRSLNTSLTVLFTLSALTIFGSEDIRTFTLTLLIGIFSGTYSSIFNASMLLAIWERGELGLWRLSRDRIPPAERQERELRELARSRG